MTKNNIDVSTLTVSSASIGLDSASPDLATVEEAGARSARIVPLDGDVYWRDDGDVATSADDRLDQRDALVIEGYRGDRMNQILGKLRFLRVSGDVKMIVHWYD